MPEKKKPWVEPELIVITRSQPEEVILGCCKGVEPFGPGSAADSCITCGTNCSQTSNS